VFGAKKDQKLKNQIIGQFSSKHHKITIKKLDDFLVMFGPGPKKHNKLKEQKLDHLWNDKHQKIENDTN